MSDFQFLKNAISGKWVVSAPKRSHRPDGQTHAAVCPFCPGQEANDEVFRIGGPNHWNVRVIANKFPFTQYHEVIIHSPYHHHNFDTLAQSHVELVLQTYRQRYNFHAEHGQVYIFQNHGHEAGESIGHPHSQLVVVPFNVELGIPTLSSVFVSKKAKEEMPWFTQKWWGWPDGAGGEGRLTEEVVETEHFSLFCPETSEWPDEVWVAPKRAGEAFGSITDTELKDFAFVLMRLLQIFDIRHGKEFPFNFYIYPGKNWYLRLIPRIKVLGGFEVGTGIMVNTQEPTKTIEFIKEHFKEPDFEKIKTHHRADYRKKV